MGCGGVCVVERSEVGKAGTGRDPGGIDTLVTMCDETKVVHVEVSGEMSGSKAGLVVG